MAYSITTTKELKKHVDFDIGIVTDNLKDGEFFAEDKKVTSRSKVYVVKIPKAGVDKLKPKLRKIGVKNPFTKDVVEIDVPDETLKLRLQKTGKTSTASDGKTTAMQENASLLIIKEGLANKKRYHKVQDISKGKIYKDLVAVYPDINDTWMKGLLAQHKKMNSEFTGAKFDEFNRDGGFMDWVTKYVRRHYGIAKKDTWNPADIWLIKNEKVVKNRLNAAQSLEQFNDIMRTLYKKKELCGISLKAVSGSSARFEEMNMQDELPDATAYSLEEITMKFSTNQSGELDTTDTVIKVSTGNQSMAGNKSAKFQIRQNSKGFNNLKFEPTQVGAGAARLGKVPLDMLKDLLKDYGVTTRDYENKWQNYPANGQEWEEEQDDYKKLYDAVHSSVKSNIVKNTFSDNVNKSFLTSDAENGYTTSKLMQLKFVYHLLSLSTEEQNTLLTEMLYLGMKVGKRFGPHGKLY